MQQNKLLQPTLADVLFLTLILGSLFFILLGNRPLFVPDEGRYAEIAREMAISNNFVTPYLNGIIYFEKPALFYWLGAGIFKLTGFNLWSIRSINALFGLFGCLITYCTACKLYGRRVGIIAALILGTNLLYFIMAHMVSLDLPVSFFLMTCLYAFLLGSREPPGTKRRLYIYVAASAAACAVLTKGLIGIVFPILIIGAWASILKKWRLVLNLYLPTSLIIFLIIAAPWHILAQVQHPDFFHFYFVEQHFLRYVDHSIGHNEPIWFFIPYLLAGFLPWIIFLPAAVKQKLDDTQLFFILWAAIIFIFFSFSKSKLIPYILPMFPALSMLTARYVATIRTKTIVVVTVFTWISLLVILMMLPKLDTRTIRPLADILKPHLQDQDEIITYNQYYQDLPFYLQRRVSILNWRNELSYGMQHQDTSKWMIDDQTFWQRYHSQQHVYVIISNNEYEKLKKNHPNESVYILGRTKTNLLISNHPT